MTTDNKQTKLNIVFMGTSDLAGIVLKSLLEDNYQISTVVTQPDHISNNKKTITVSPVKQTAQTNENIKILQPTKLDDDFIKEIKQLRPDLIIVVAYGKILSEKILNIPKFKSINIHASLLPKLRGPSPIQNALLQGLSETGTTIMLMDKGIDTGDILAQEKITIQKSDDYATLTSKLAVLSANLLLKTLPKWIAGKIDVKKQDNSKATMCQLIERSDGKISWNENAIDIINKFRAFRIWPGIFTFWENKKSLKKISLTDISLMENDPLKNNQFGEVFKNSKGEIAVQASTKAIIINKLQLAGKKEVTIQDFINGYPNFIGSILK